MKSSKFILSCFSIFCTFFLLSCCTIQIKRFDMRDGDVNYYKNTVKLEVEGIGESPGIIASGFAIDDNRIMTAGHFCDSILKGQILELLKEEVKATYVNEKGLLETIGGGIVDSLDVEKDICIVRNELHGIVPLVVSSQYNRIRINDKVTVVGAPHGFFPFTSFGHVISPISENLPEGLNNRLIINAAGTFGNSGGPVIDENGEVIGMVMARAIFPHILFAVHADTLRLFLWEQYGE